MTIRGLHRWYPVGMIIAGPRAVEKSGDAENFDIIFLRRLHFLQADGTIAREIA